LLLDHKKTCFQFFPIPCPGIVKAGQLNVNNADYVLKTLNQAIQACLSKKCIAMVTGPVHKGIINEAGHLFTGHTEYLAQLTHVDDVVMMLMTDKLKVALVTTHLPLKEVSYAISREKLKRTIEILYTDLQNKFSIRNPKIHVCGLNPHAGEGGHLGHEEQNIIIPVLQELRQYNNWDLIGPLPADTAFTPHALADTDAVLAMYHDQGLPVIKYAGFGHIINVTLGLPFIRTSVDHGTALNLAGTGDIEIGSLRQAILLAIQLGLKHQRV
jgi:4-hydroxythreonine-4-phosphate dehydrogenase